MERIFSILALVAAIGAGAYAYVTTDRQKGEIEALGQKVEGLTKTLGETQKAVTNQRQDFEGLVTVLQQWMQQHEGAGAPEAPQLDMTKLSGEANDKFLADYEKQDRVVKRPSGLMYRAIKDGPAGGKSPHAHSSITITYKGAFIDGTVFDQSDQPVTFPLDQLIPGWVEALPLMKEGDTWELVVPYALGYGEQGKGMIPPKQTLVFQIELVKVES
ncbi:MAG: FKBP-type peptidyl-prolyl cis-trans isomerase [Alphaproteobacteria bacterium]|nr:FKBP-type peptidyl-prolyl cis-trans isomerase [Alphaproteobacteria bacterium]